MRIAFLHSCLEPGKDGVGDYIRLLAAECERMGHPACALALNDPYALGGAAENGSGLPSLRLHAQQPWEGRVESAKAFLAAFKPDLISLQFVSYGYNPKGIAYGIAARLKTLVGSTPVHIMFHELWLGAQTGASLKEKVIGAVQRHFVLGLIQQLRPRLIHSSNPAYAQLLAKYGIEASCLPLFGQIPISSEMRSDWITAELKAGGLDIQSNTRETVWLFGLFGTLHPVWPPEPLFAALREAGQRYRRKIAIVSVGRMGGGENLWRELVSGYGRDFSFYRFGERSPEQISQLFQFIDFGIATTPWEIIGKSGAAKAMLEHGLPVIVNRDELRFPFAVPHPPSAPSLYKLGNDLGERLPELKRRPARGTLADIAQRFLEEIGAPPVAVTNP